MNYLKHGIILYQKEKENNVFQVRTMSKDAEAVVQGCSVKKLFLEILQSFAKFFGKDLYESLFFNKVAGLRSTTLFKKKLWHRCFPANFLKFLRTPFLKEHLW